MNENPKRGFEPPDGPLPADVQAWLQAHPEESGNELEQVWRMAGGAQGPAPAPDDARFADLRAAVLAETRTPRTAAPDRTPRPAPRMRRIWIAASLVALVALGVAIGLRPVTLSAPARERLAATLPDGSRVELNSGSRLTYRRSFGWRARRVEIDGEGFFEVVHDDTPFTVTTFNGHVTVLGTRFNVRAWPGEDHAETTVVLQDGRVRFSARARPDAPVVLAPGQMSRLAGTDEPTAPEPIDVDQRISWRDGGMTFIDQPIGAVLDEIERRFATRVAASPASLRQVRISLVLNDVQDAEQVLAAIARVRGYSYRKTGDGYLIASPD
ncbi:MAG: FecR domain-containing protein [Rhodothermales bacterium]